MRINIPVEVKDITVSITNASAISGYKIEFLVSTDKRMSNAMIRQLAKGTRLVNIIKKRMQEFTLEHSTDIINRNQTITNGTVPHMYTENHGVLHMESNVTRIRGYIKICQKDYTLENVVNAIRNAKIQIGTLAGTEK